MLDESWREELTGKMGEMILTIKSVASKDEWLTYMI